AGNAFIGIETAEGVLAEGVSQLYRPLAEGDVVRLGAGEILQSGAKRFRCQHADVDLHSSAQFETHLVSAPHQHIDDAGKGDNAIHKRIEPLVSAAWAGDEDIEVADSFASPAQRTRGGDLFHAGYVGQEFDQMARDHLCFIEMITAGDPTIFLNAFK